MQQGRKNSKQSCGKQNYKKEERRIRASASPKSVSELSISGITAGKMILSAAAGTLSCLVSTIATSLCRLFFSVLSGVEWVFWNTFKPTIKFIIHIFDLQLGCDFPLQSCWHCFLRANLNRADYGRVGITVRQTQGNHSKEEDSTATARFSSPSLLHCVPVY